MFQLRAVMAISTVLLIALCAPLCADATGHVVAAIQLGSPVINIPLSGTALLQQQATINLSPGPNRLAFAFSQLGIDLNKLSIDIVSPAEGVEVTDTAIAPHAPDTVLWEITAEKDCAATIAISFPLSGIEWRVEYTGVINQASETIDISADVVLTNKSKLEFPSAVVELPSMDPVKTALLQNETFHLALCSSAGIPYRPAYIHDPVKYKGGTTAVLSVLRDGDAVFCQRSMPGGKIRIYAPGKPAVYIGEDTLPYLPPREPVDVTLGTVPDISVARKVISSTQVDVKSDIRQKLALFNLDDKIEFEIKNLRKVPAVLFVRDQVTDDWEITEQSVPSESIDAGTLLFVVNLAPGETRKMTYTVRRKNLQP